MNPVNVGTHNPKADGQSTVLPTQYPYVTPITWQGEKVLYWRVATDATGLAFVVTGADKSEALKNAKVIRAKLAALGGGK